MSRFRDRTWVRLARWVVLCSAGCSDAYAPAPAPEAASPAPAGDSKPSAPAVAEAALQVLAEGEDQPWSLAIDERYVYWTTRTELRRAPRAGGAAKTLATGEGLRRVTAAEGGVFVTDGLGGKVLRVDRESGFAEVIGTGVYPEGIAVRDRNLYWANGSSTLGSGSLATVRLDDKTSSILVDGLAQPGGVAADDEFVYFTSTAQGCSASGCFGGGVSKRARAFGAVQVIDTQGTPADVVVGKRGVYWILPGVQVMFAPFSASRAQVLAEIPREGTGPIAVDAEAFYFGSSDYGRVLKVGLDDRKPLALVTDLGSVGGIAVDVAWVYVAATSQGRILRVAKDGSAAVPSAAISGPCVMPLGTAAEIAATPRADESLEMLALRVDSGRVTASEETYARVGADIAAIRGAQPELADIGHFPRDDGKALLLALDDLTALSFAKHEYTAWDCLNDFYGLESLEPVSASYALLTLKGNYDLELLAGLYLQLPGIRGASANQSGGNGPTICARRAGSNVEYVFDRASGDCLAGCIDHDAHAFLSTAPGVIEAMGAWNSQASETPPDWFRRVCLR